MKKLFLLFTIVPLFGITSSTLNFEIVNATNDENLLTSEQHETLVNQLKGALRIESDVTTFRGVEINYVNEVDDHAYYFALSHNNELLLEDYIVGDENNFAYYNKINISNEAELIPLYEEEDEDANITFTENYGSLFRRLAKISYEDFHSYFTVSENEDGYTLIPTTYGYGLLNNDIANFFQFNESFVWDDATVRYVINDLVLNLDNLGNLKDFSFSRVKRDKFGAIEDHFVSSVTSISEAKRLKGLDPIMDEETSKAFVDKVSAFQNKISEGNFTQIIKTSDPNIGTYNTYYMLDGSHETLPPVMVSDIRFHDTTYGLTYFGVMPDSGGFVPYAFSPDAGYMGSYSNLKYEDLSEVLPNYLKISADFFRPVLNFYVLDFTKLTVIDYLFSVNILYALLSPIDPINTHTYNYFDMDAFEYRLQKLTVSFDEEGNLTANLSYENDNGLNTTDITFKDIGTTDITNVSTLTPVVHLINAYMEGM